MPLPMIAGRGSRLYREPPGTEPTDVFPWPNHDPGYLTVLPRHAGVGMDTPAGSGRRVVGGNSASVYFVTSLADANTGGAASPTWGPRVFAGTAEWCWRNVPQDGCIVFLVSGWINCAASIPMQTGTPPRPGYVSVYGQTAPQPGVFFRGTRLSLNGASNVVLWHLRSYFGDDVGGLNADNRDCINSGYAGGTTSHVVLINCEAAWSVDELVDFYRPHTAVTWVYCAFIEPLHDSTINHTGDPTDEDHGFGPMNGGDTDTPLIAVGAFTCYRNLFTHGTDRNPATTSIRFAHASNLHYNHGRPGGGVGVGPVVLQQANVSAMAADFIGNMFVRGPENNTSLVAIKAQSGVISGSHGYSAKNVQFGWTAPANQSAFITSSPATYVSATLTGGLPSSWDGELDDVHTISPTPLSPSTAEGHAFIDLIDESVGAQPAWRSVSSPGRVYANLQQIRDRLNGGSTSFQFVDTVAEAGGWFSVAEVTIDPLNPGSHWHAAIPTGSDRDTPVASGTFSNGLSCVGYTPLEIWAIEQHWYVGGK